MHGEWLNFSLELVPSEHVYADQMTFSTKIF